MDYVITVEGGKKRDALINISRITNFSDIDFTKDNKTCVESTKYVTNESSAMLERSWTG